MRSGRPVFFQRAVLSVLLLSAVSLLGAAGCGGGGEDQNGFAAAKPGSLVPGATSDSLAGESSAAAMGVGTSAAESGLMADPDRIEPVLQDAQAQDPSALKAVAPAPQAATASAGPFSLQLGSFTNVDNARKQGDRIRGLGHDPVIEASSLGGQIYHRVMLKGFRNQSEATRLGEKIRSELGIAYLVRRTN